MRLGFFPNGSGAYPEIPLTLALHRIAQVGYESIDVQAHAGIRDGLDSEAYTPDDRQRLRADAQRLGLRIAAIVTSPGLVETVGAGRPLDLLSAVRLAEDLSAEFVTVHVLRADSPPDARWRDRAVALRSIAEAARAGAGSGVSILLDALVPDSYVGSPQQIAEFLGDVGEPNVGWNADPAFLSVAGFDAPQAIAELAPWLRHVHLKGARGRWPNVEWLLPGDGELDAADVISALASIDFRGTITAEPVAHPRGHDGDARWSFEEAVTRSREALGQAMKIASQRVA